MKNKYIKSEDISPVVGQKVYVQTLSGESLCVFSFQRGSPLFRWTPVENGLGSYYGDRSWRPYDEEVKSMWIDSRKEKPVPDSLPVWITHGPGEEVRAATFVRWYHPSSPSQPGCGWKVGVGGTTFIDPFFWQEREVPKVITPPEPMPEPVRTDGWLRLGASKPENLQQVWVATVNEGVQPARFISATEPRVTRVAEGTAFFTVTYGPAVGQIYTGNFLLWQPRQAQPEYPIL